MNILPEVLKEKDYLVSVRRHLHKNPELSLKEFATATYIEEQLDAAGITNYRIGETGILGTITGKLGEGKTILLRTEIDALPIQEETGASYSSRTLGVMHACGHDAHTASLLCAAKVLQSLSDSFAGKILLVFQQAEEFGHGSRFFLAEHITDGVDRAFGIHVSPEFPVGTVAMANGPAAASCDYFKIKVNGKGAHISKPKKGIDALYIASLIIMNLKTIAAKVAGPNEIALVGVGKITSGTSYNIIAEDAVIEGTTRTFSYDTQELLKQKVIELADTIASENGGSVHTEFETFTSALINDSEAFDEVYESVRTVVGTENIITDKNVVTGFGADDFAEYLRETKGVYVHVGTANVSDPNTKNSLHSSKFDVDEHVLLIAASLHITYSLSVLKEK
ncbi:MAG TPA: M20 family metallopeptidase [Clostridia bacterium]|nr:M20 family metallopeptidase [Clostridia bacterium]